MREDEAGRARVPWHSNPILTRLARAGGHLSGAVLLAVGAANAFAARRNRQDNGKHDPEEGKNGRDRDREDREIRDRDDRQDKDASREDRQARKDDREASREQSDASGGNRNRDRNRDRKSDETADDSDVDSEKKKRNDGNKNDDSNGEDDGGGGDGGDGGGRGDGGGGNNAGSAAFDNPLTTKARRRAKDFEDRDRDDDEDDRIVGDVDSEGESVFQTGSISFATGPDGVEIETANITYIAAPTPTPTPFPRLEFPERDGYPFGDDFPFGVVRPEQTPTTAAPTDSGDDVLDPEPGDSPPPQDALLPSDPLPSAPDGGDNSTDFAS